MIFSAKINTSGYLKKIIKLNPKICSGRKNYSKFENRITKNILLTDLFVKKKDIKFFLGSKIKIEIHAKIIKLICS